MYTLYIPFVVKKLHTVFYHSQITDTRTPPGPEISPSSVALPNEGPTSTSRHAVGTNTPGIDPGSVTVSPQVHPTPIVPSEDILDTKTVVGTEPSPIPPVMVGTEPSPISPVVVGTEPSPISPVVVGTEPSPIPPVLVGTEPSPIPPVVVETEPPPIPPVVDSTSKVRLNSSHHGTEEYT